MILWTSPSTGAKIAFQRFDPDATTWHTCGGLYMFVAEGTPNRVLYVGRTSNFAERFAKHHKIDDARRRGMSAIYAAVHADEIIRIICEGELAREWRPPLNEIAPAGAGIIGREIALANRLSGPGLGAIR